MDYAAIKELAKENGCTIRDLIALAPQNDPFYIGTDSQLRLAEWFRDLWQRLGYIGKTNVHIRRVHYKMISQPAPILMPNGMAYENTDPCWHTLEMAAKYARYHYMVDLEAFDDRRNGKPLVYLEEKPDPGIGVDDQWNDLELPPFPGLPRYEIWNFEPDQRYHLEIWAEKSTQNDILIPLCQNFGMALVTGLGELSITHVKWLIQRLRKYQKPCRIFYVSDFDPAGRSMPVAISRKIEKLLSDMEEPFDVRLYPIILTPEQCISYKLPRTPIKETERRATKFEGRFGEGATELDALEAIHPGEMKRILEDAIYHYWDPDLRDEVSNVAQALIEDADLITGEACSEHWGEIRELRAQYDRIAKEAKEALAEISERTKEIWDEIKDDLEEFMPDIEDYPIPEGREANELPDPLFDSQRDYMEQLGVYKAFQGKGER
jgi:hypothetical protein